MRGQPGITNCVYCKKQVFPGDDSYISKKTGHLNSSHISCMKWHHNTSIQYAHLFLGNVCQCCGSRENIEAGHINFPQDKIVTCKSTKTGFAVRTKDDSGHPGFLKLIVEHAVIPVCASCNKSMGNGSTCRVHQKYLGIWNYLPKIENLETV